MRTYKVELKKDGKIIPGLTKNFKTINEISEHYKLKRHHVISLIDEKWKTKKFLHGDLKKLVEIIKITSYNDSDGFNLDNILNSIQEEQKETDKKIITEIEEHEKEEKNNISVKEIINKIESSLN